MSDQITLPLSTAQRGMWVGQQIAPADAVFNIAEAIELHGVICPASLTQALLQATTEMETLRVRIVEQSGLPFQHVRERFDDPIPLLDFSTAPDPFAAAMAWADAEVRAPVDFQRDQVWVSAVLKVADDRWIWYHRAHHIMLDGFSGGMVVQRVSELYTAIRQRREPSAPVYGPLSTLIEHEAAYRNSERYAKDRAYWMARMADLPAPVTLARRHAPGLGGLLRSTAMVPQSVVLALRARITGQNVSLPQALIALIAAYYYRMTGASDLVFGLPVTARANGAMRRCPGMVANAVAIRLAMSGLDRFDDLFLQVSRAVRESLRHQQYRYEDLRRDLGLLNQGEQIARLGINIEPFDYELTFDGVRATPHNLSNAHMEDLTVFVYDRADGSGLRIDLDANAALYRAAELDAHKQRLSRLIELVTTNPDLRLGDIDILDAQEHRLIEQDWNDTADAEPVQTIPEWFGRQAQLTPDRLAVVFDCDGRRTLSYRALDRQSAELARVLSEHQVGPGDVVAIALPRSELLPVALLGIMRVGAAYLPVDPDGPADRMQMILADASPALMLTLKKYEKRFGEAEFNFVFLDKLHKHAPASPAPALPGRPPIDPQSNAYILYTSGSTGRPKGVEVTHANLSNFIEGMRRLLNPTEADRLLSVSTITFDIAGLEIFLPLVVGACVVIAGSATIRDPLALGRLVRGRKITMLQATPSLWRTLLANREVDLTEVHALVGGEALSAELAARMLDRTQAVTNLYGPTETTIWSTAMTLSADDIDPPPIGRPILNTQLYVLDEQMRTLPPGAVGTLYIGGAGVARGYLNQQAMTDARFIADPFLQGTSRIYNTGDLARWREDGVMEYLGRNDSQVKIRGHRIEPGEIETHLARHEMVAEAAVMAQSDPTGDLVLVAYIVAEPDAAPSRDLLREHLSGRIPEIMIPSLFMMLDAMPQTSNGKLNRRALPLPQWSREARLPPCAPRTETERRLLEIWETVLGRQDIGVHDNFFELGGDSLRGAQLFVAISEAFQQEIPFGSLFRSSTIAGLAGLLEQQSAEDPLDRLLPLKITGSRPPLFCVHPIIGLGWSYASLLPHIHADQPLYALQADGLRLRADEEAGRPASIEAMAAEYLTEVRRVQPHGPYHLLGWSLGGLVAHAMAAQLADDGEEVAFLAMLDSYVFRPDTNTTAMDEHRQVELALAFLGLEPTNSHPAPPNLGELADYLCVEYDLLEQPMVKAVMRSQPDLMARLERVVCDNLALARRYTPRRIEVDAMFCVATLNGAEHGGVHPGGGGKLDALIEHRPEAWQRFVRRLTIHEIPSSHQDILAPHAAERIGNAMREHAAFGQNQRAYA